MASVTYGKCNYGKNIMANETEPSAHVKVARVNIEIKLLKGQRYPRSKVLSSSLIEILHVFNTTLSA